MTSKLVPVLWILLVCSMAYSFEAPESDGLLGEHASQSSNLEAVLTLIILKSGFYDEDEDGVEDDSDQCPDTPAGEVVDEGGCSLLQQDADGDGVADAGDVCPLTPAGQSVDEAGCAQSQLDSDADGLNDDTDACPAAPPEAMVDGEGCAESQLDDDFDGVANNIDDCPGTPLLLAVDDRGCSAFQVVRLVYEADVNPLIVSAQAGCTSSGCHGRSGAPGGLRLHSVGTLNNVQLNFDSFVAYIGRESAARLLSKISGANHVGGVRYESSSSEYAAIAGWAQSVEAQQ